MSEEFPWADPAVLARLSRLPVGEQLARQVAERLVANRGDKGIWNSHRDYCGHGLIYLEGAICLVEVQDGMAREGAVLKAWDSEEEFTRWLARQSNLSLSGSDSDEPILHCSDPFRLNNQRLTCARLAEFASGKEILPVFRDYLTILETAFAFLVDEFGFEMAPPEMVGRECEVVFRIPSHSAISVVCEPFASPQLVLSLNAVESGESLSNAPLAGLARQRAPEWQTPRFGIDAPGEESNLYDCFAHYEKVLRSHFQDVLVPETSAAPSAQTRSDDSDGAQQPESGRKSRIRIYGFGLVLVAIVIMVLELRYLFDHGTPDATGSSRANLGQLILMGLPWVVCVAGVIQVLSGVDIRHYNPVFSQASLPARVGILILAILAALFATVIAFLLA